MDLDSDFQHFVLPSLLHGDLDRGLEYDLCESNNEYGLRCLGDFDRLLWISRLNRPFESSLVQFFCSVTDLKGVEFLPLLTVSILKYGIWSRFGATPERDIKLFIRKRIDIRVGIELMY